jgi:hypothetical protein
MIEKIVQTAKHTVKAMVDSHKARDCAPGSGAVDAWDMPFSVILSGSTDVWAPGQGKRLDQDQVIAGLGCGIRREHNWDKTRGNRGRILA